MHTTSILFIGGMITLVVFLVIPLVKWIFRSERIQQKYARKEKPETVLIKKYREADLTSYQPAAMRIGFIASMMMVSLAFSMSNDGLPEKPKSIYFPAEEELDLEQHESHKVEKEEIPPEEVQLEVVEDEILVDEVDTPPIDEIDIDDVVVTDPISVDIPDVDLTNEPVMSEGEVEETIFIVVEENAMFPGGTDALMQYLASNIQYPPIAIENGVEGMVVLRFIVSKTGAITGIEVLKDIGAGCGAEAVRVVQSMPQWNPGKQRGNPVSVYFTLPVSFRLN